MTAAVFQDLRKGIISNVLILFGFLGGAVFQLIRLGGFGLILFLGSAAFPVLLFSILYYFRMIGAGDIKLLAALGGFLGISAVSGNQIGAGDGLLLIALGTVLETEEYLRTLCLSLIGCGLWAVILLGILRKKKTTELPFVPFVLLGYVGGLLL